MRGWHLYWLAWATISFLAFIGPEVYALCTDARRTLSWAVWDLEDMAPGQPIGHWTVAHFWFVAIFACLVLWLGFHFAMGWWR